MQIKNAKLHDLYQRFCNYIISEYPRAVFSEGKSYVTISYPGELARIFICQDTELNTLVIRITTDIYKKLGAKTSLKFYVNSLDELNEVKSAAHVIMAQRISEEKGNAQILKVASDTTQGYVYDYNKKLIGVVQLDLIPTNAYITNIDKINAEDNSVTEEETAEEKARRARTGTISKFFKRQK